jgi:hypothetical protein
VCRRLWAFRSISRDFVGVSIRLETRAKFSFPSSPVTTTPRQFGSRLKRGTRSGFTKMVNAVANERPAATGTAEISGRVCFVLLFGILQFALSGGLGPLGFRAFWSDHPGPVGGAVCLHAGPRTRLGARRRVGRAVEPAIEHFMRIFLWRSRIYHRDWGVRRPHAVPGWRRLLAEGWRSQFGRLSIRFGNRHRGRLSSPGAS